MFFILIYLFYFIFLFPIINSSPPFRSSCFSFSHYGLPLFPFPLFLPSTYPPFSYLLSFLLLPPSLETIYRLRCFWESFSRKVYIFLFFFSFFFLSFFFLFFVFFHFFSFSFLFLLSSSLLSLSRKKEGSKHRSGTQSKQRKNQVFFFSLFLISFSHSHLSPHPKLNSLRTSPPLLSPNAPLITGE